ncbi:MAG: hypothetical protein QXO77_04890 [Saccharolobus sp.]
MSYILIYFVVTCLALAFSTDCLYNILYDTAVTPPVTKSPAMPKTTEPTANVVGLFSNNAAGIPLGGTRLIED